MVANLTKLQLARSTAYLSQIHQSGCPSDLPRSVHLSIARIWLEPTLALAPTSPSLPLFSRQRYVCPPPDLPRRDQWNSSNSPNSPAGKHRAQSTEHIPYEYDAMAGSLPLPSRDGGESEHFLK